MSNQPTTTQVICSVLFFIILGIPLAGIGIAMLIMAEGIECWSGLIFLAFAFGVGQHSWGVISGK
ncbi:hypothetical protein [Kluyvera ascorbata]